VTFDELINRVLEFVGEDPDGPKDFTRAEIGRYVNDTYRQMVRDTQALEAQLWLYVEEGVATYTLPPTMEQIQRVGHRDRRIAELSVFELDRINETWEDEAGEVDAYTIDQRNSGTLRTYRTPDYEDRFVLEDAYGTITNFTDENGDTDTDWHLRFASLVASLGVVCDYEVTDETVTFEAAAAGGGADADYGIVVDIVDSANASLYTFDSELGVVVDVEDDTTTDYDDIVFEGGGENTSTSEFGVVILVEADDEHWLINNQEGVPVKAPASELGTAVWLKNDEEILEIWANETPVFMVEDVDEPLLPAWTHLGIAYGAAAKALAKVASTKDEFVGGAYAAMYLVWQKFLKETSADSTREMRRGFGQTLYGARRVRKGPRLPGEYPRV